MGAMEPAGHGVQVTLLVVYVLAGHTAHDVAALLLWKPEAHGWQA